MPADFEKLILKMQELFVTKANEGNVVKLEGMEDHLNVTQYKELISWELKYSKEKNDAQARILEGRKAYLEAKLQLRIREKELHAAVTNGIKLLEEQDKNVKELNSKMKRGDYSMLKKKTASDSSPVMTTMPIQKSHDLPPLVPLSRTNAKPHLDDIKQRLAKLNVTDDSIVVLSQTEKATTSIPQKSELKNIKNRLAEIISDTPVRAPLQTINANKPASAITPKCDPLSAKGSLDGSIVNNRNTSVPLTHDTWNIRAPNFDDTVDESMAISSKPSKNTFVSVPSTMLDSPLADDEGEHTFELPRPSLPFQTPTVPLSRPFLLSSMRKKEEESAATGCSSSTFLPPRPVLQYKPAATAAATTSILDSLTRPTMQHDPAAGTASAATERRRDPLDGGIMGFTLKRPVMLSEAGKKMVGQL